MLEHAPHDRVIISAICLTMVLVILLLFGKSAQAELVIHSKEDCSQSMNIDYEIPDLTEFKQINYHAYNSGDTRIIKRLFSN